MHMLNGAFVIHQPKTGDTDQDVISPTDTAWQTFADLLDPPRNPYVRDPVGWVTSKLGEFWWSGQHRMAQSVVDNRYSAFTASHDVSKSHTMSRLALWWIDVHPPGEACVVTTAPTTPQVEAILWRYMSNAHKKGGLPGRITLDAKWYIGNELVAYGRKPADYDPAAFHGIHARYVLVIIDMAGGVPKSIFDAVDALATNIDARVVAVGNPDDPASHFATICKPGSGWHVETISAFDTPAYTGEKVPEDLLPLLVSPEWVEERKLRRGVNSPIYQSKVLGEFPDLSDDTLILPRWIEAAQKRTLPHTRRPLVAADIARFGEDETVIMRREGGWIRTYRAHHKADTMTTTGHIVNAIQEIDAEEGKTDWVRAVVMYLGLVVEWWTAWPSSICRLCRTTAVRHRSTRSASSTLERRITGHCESGSSRARSTLIPMTTSLPPSSARSSGASILVAGSRSSRRMTCASVDCRHRIGPTRVRSPSLARPMLHR
jgi:hypothetical protein